MAQTKITLIADGVIDENHLKAGHTITTDNIGEGTALYYTDARVASYLSSNDYATQNYVTTALTNLSDVQSITFTTDGTLELPSGNVAQRPLVPQQGQTRYNTETKGIEFYDGTDWKEIGASGTIKVQYLVIAGGGGGGRYDAGNNYGGGGGGGAGGYRSSVEGEDSGGKSITETPLFLDPSKSYTVTIGAGGAGRTGSTGTGTSGSNSVFHSVTSIGGGGGGGESGVGAGLPGGSGGGGDGQSINGPAGTSRLAQGSNGAKGAFINGIFSYGGGGGGAGSPGVEGGSAGGEGVASSITGSSITRAVGGAGRTGIGTGPGNSAPANTGSGGVGGDFGDAGTGGSGIVIIKYSDIYTLTIDPGLTATTDSSSVSGYKITTFTAGTGNIVFN
jgi:hypothetical protein